MTVKPYDKPVHRLAAPQRRAHANTFVGRRVAVTWSALRDPDHTRTHVGRALAVAVVNVGTVADVMVLDIGADKYPMAISLATVISIKEV